MLKNILYILLLERLHFDRSGDPPHHPLYSGSFPSVALLERQVGSTKIVQPINISEWIQGRIRNSFSGEIFRHSDKHQATNSWQEQFQIQSPEIHRAQFMLQKKNMARNRFSDKILKVAIEKKQHNCLFKILT